MEWLWAPFDALTLREWYAISALRERVFIVEQKCVYQDLDGRDSSGWHLLGWGRTADHEPQLQAYLRVLPPGARFPEYSIGRFVTAPEVRGQGVGKQLMREGLKHIDQEWGPQPLRISAQAYLEKFYRQFGFIPTGKRYLEDEIPHLEMFRSPS